MPQRPLYLHKAWQGDVLGKERPDETEVFDLAIKCPLTNGTVVYAARNLYNALKGEIYRFEDNCAGGNSSRGGKQSTKFVSLHPRKPKTLIANTDKLLVYPNPAYATITVKATNIKQVEIVDMLGRVVLTKKITDSKDLQLSIAQLNKGLYLVKTVDAFNKINTIKFIKN